MRRSGARAPNKPHRSRALLPLMAVHGQVIVVTIQPLVFKENRIKTSLNPKAILPLTSPSQFAAQRYLHWEMASWLSRTWYMTERTFQCCSNGYPDTSLKFTIPEGDGRETPSVPGSGELPNRQSSTHREGVRDHPQRTEEKWGCCVLGRKAGMSRRVLCGPNSAFTEVSGA